MDFGPDGALISKKRGSAVPENVTIRIGADEIEFHLREQSNVDCCTFRMAEKGPDLARGRSRRHSWYVATIK
jgi:hypothetical protein